MTPLGLSCRKDVILSGGEQGDGSRHEAEVQGVQEAQPQSRQAGCATDLDLDDLKMNWLPLAITCRVGTANSLV